MLTFSGGPALSECATYVPMFGRLHLQRPRGFRSVGFCYCSTARRDILTCSRSASNAGSFLFNGLSSKPARYRRRSSICRAREFFRVNISGSVRGVKRDFLLDTIVNVLRRATKFVGDFTGSWPCLL